MTTLQARTRWLVLLAMILAAGCAPQYHSYRDCYIECKYCPPPPLQYTHYDECFCYSCAAATYLARNTPANASPAVDTSAEYSR